MTGLTRRQAIQAGTSPKIQSQRAEELFQLLQQARNEADLAIVVVTHSEAWAQNADRTLHLSDGAWRD